LAWSAIWTFSPQTVLATFSLISALTGAPVISLSTARKTLWTSAGLFGSFKMRPCASGSLLV
jgi:hypothetical protein